MAALPRSIEATRTHYETMARDAAKGDAKVTAPVPVVNVLVVLRNAHVAFSGEQARLIHEAINAVAELIDAATSAKNALAIIEGSEESDTSDMDYQLIFEDLPRLRAVLARVGGAK